VDWKGATVRMNAIPSTLDGEKAMAGESVIKGLSGCCYYILSGDNIYAAIIDTDEIKFFTN